MLLSEECGPLRAAPLRLSALPRQKNLGDHAADAAAAAALDGVDRAQRRPGVQLNELSLCRAERLPGTGRDCEHGSCAPAIQKQHVTGELIDLLAAQIKQLLAVALQLVAH